MSEQSQVVSAAPASAGRARTALRMYSTMAIVAGCALFVLAVVVIIHYGFDNAGPSHLWSPIHGLIFMAYVASVANLGLKMRWSLRRMVGVMLAGVVPFLTFFVERRIKARVLAQLAGPDR